jgi:hypothetical protein
MQNVHWGWRGPLAALLVLSACGVLRAEPASALNFDLHTAEGAPARGALEKLDEAWNVDLGGTKPVRATGGEVISLRRVGLPPPAYPTGEQVLFVNGDRVPGAIERLGNERLRLHSDLGTPADLTIPLAALSVLWFAAPEGGGDAEALRHRLAAERRTRDRVLLRNGDVVEGTLAALDAARVRLDADGKDLELERGKVAVVALNTDLPRSLRPRGQYGRLVLANGCRLSLASARCDGRLLAGRTLVGATVEVPLEQVRALDLYHGRALYLSDLKPRRYEHVPYLGVSWPWVADGSVTGRDLRLAGGTFDKGLGLHSASRLTYDLGGRYHRFEALVGLDEHSGRAGHVVVGVLLDGKPQNLGWDGTLDGGEPPHPVRLAVAGAQSLTLVVEFGRRGDVADHVNWADARLIK